MIMASKVIAKKVVSLLIMGAVVAGLSMFTAWAAAGTPVTKRVSGTVVDADSHLPVTGAEVHCWHALQDGTIQNWDTHADMAGRFEFSGLVDDGEYTLFATAPRHVIRSPVKTTVPTSAGVVLELARLLTMRGSLVAPGGSTLAFDGPAYLEVRSEGGIPVPAIRIRKGVFVVENVAAGKYELVVPGLLTAEYALKGPATFEVKGGQNAVAVAFPVERAVQLQILARDSETHQPIPKASVGVEFENMRTPVVVVTDEEGRAKVFAPQGMAQVYSADPGARYVYNYGQGKKFSVKGEGTQVVVDMEPYATLRGSVVTAGGKPVADACVRFTYLRQGKVIVGDSATTRRDGTFENTRVLHGPSVILVQTKDADGLAPIVEPLMLQDTPERKFVLGEGVEVAFKVQMDPSFLADPKEPVPEVLVIDQKIGEAVFIFSCSSGEPGKEKMPVTEVKTRLLPGKYKVVCARGQRACDIGKFDLEGPRMVPIEVEKTAVFNIDRSDLLKDIRFPQGP